MRGKSKPQKSKLKVLFLAAEAYPFVKIGGLGEVAGSLPQAIRRCSSDEVDIRLVIPFHGAIQRRDFPIHRLTSFALTTSQATFPVEVLETDLNGLPVYFISGPPITPDAPVYSRDNFVDGYKFTFFSLAALELARSLDWAPHILHANDWHTAPAVYALKLRKHSFFEKTTALMGVHNLPYMGEGASSALSLFGLPPSNDGRLPWWARHTPLPLGLLHADHIVVVSPQYAREILAEKYGAGLQDFLKTRRRSITGILNGLDTEQWDPATDTALVANYSIESLAIRKANKKALAEEFTMALHTDIPLVAMVSRLDHQKGVDLLCAAIRLLARERWQLIILGMGLPELEQSVRLLETELPDQVRAIIRYDALLSRRIYAGADVMLIPSRYEPCGLTQMIAMRYGCVPVAYATGGLIDTIHDHPEQIKTGFLFTRPTPKGLAAAIKNALALFANAEAWQNVQCNGMQKDFSWERSAKQYINLYQNLDIGLHQVSEKGNIRS